MGSIDSLGCIGAVSRELAVGNQWRQAFLLFDSAAPMIFGFLDRPGSPELTILLGNIIDESVVGGIGLGSDDVGDGLGL